MRAGILIMTLFLTAVPTVFAQTDAQTNGQNSDKTRSREQKKHVIYEWTDNKGNVHMTDRLEEVPEQYRSTVRRMETSAGEETKGKKQGFSPYTGSSGGEEDDTGQKAYWQNRMREAKQNVTQLEGRYRDLDRRRTELLGSWGGVAGGHLEGREEAARIEQEMKQVQQEIDNVRNQIEVVIPDEARKAGVPPGWLRE